MKVISLLVALVLSSSIQTFARTCDQFFTPLKSSTTHKTIDDYLSQVTEKYSIGREQPEFISARKERKKQQFWGGVNSPAFFQAAMPQFIKAIGHQLLEAAPGMVKNDGSGSIISVRTEMPFKGTRDWDTNVGMSSEAMADNILRQSKGENDFYLVRKDAEAGFLFTHGGGTKTTGHHVAASFLNKYRDFGVDVVSLDTPFHGEGARKHPANTKEFFEYLIQFRQQYFPKNMKVFFGGHSMGGYYGDMLSRAAAQYPELELHKHFAGTINLSPGADHAPGKSYAEKLKAEEKIMRDPEIISRMAPGDQNLSNDLLKSGKASPLSSFEATLRIADLEWGNMHLSDQFLPSITVIGKSDFLYVGKEQLFEDYVAKLPRGIFYLISDRVGFDGELKPTGHLIFDHTLPSPQHTLRVAAQKIKPKEFANRISSFFKDVLPREYVQISQIQGQVIKSQKFGVEIGEGREAQNTATTLDAKRTILYHLMKELSEIANALEISESSFTEFVLTGKIPDSVQKSESLFIDGKKINVSDQYQQGLKQLQEIFTQKYVESFDQLDLQRDHDKFLATLFINEILKQKMDMLLTQLQQFKEVNAQFENRFGEPIRQDEYNQPETYTVVKRFIEQTIGKPLKNQKEDTHKYKHGLIVKLVELYYNNLAYREFLEDSTVKVRVASDKLQELNARNKELIDFTKRFDRFEKQYRNLNSTNRSKEAEALKEKFMSDTFESSDYTPPVDAAGKTLSIESARSEREKITQLLSGTYIPTNNDSLATFARDNLRKQSEAKITLKELAEQKNELKTELSQVKSKISAAEAELRKLNADFTNERIEALKKDVLEAEEKALEYRDLADREGNKYAIKYKQRENSLRPLKVNNLPRSLQKAFELAGEADLEYQQLKRKIDPAITEEALKGEFGEATQELYVSLYGRDGQSGFYRELDKVHERQNFIESEIWRVTELNNELKMDYAEKVTPEYYTVVTVRIKDLIENGYSSVMENQGHLETSLNEWKKLKAEIPESDSVSLY